MGPSLVSPLPPPRKLKRFGNYRWKRTCRSVKHIFQHVCPFVRYSEGETFFYCISLALAAATSTAPVFCCFLFVCFFLLAEMGPPHQAAGSTPGPAPPPQLRHSSNAPGSGAVEQVHTHASVADGRLCWITCRIIITCRAGFIRVVTEFSSRFGEQRGLSAFPGRGESPHFPRPLGDGARLAHETAADQPIRKSLSLKAVCERLKVTQI